VCEGEGECEHVCVRRCTFARSAARLPIERQPQARRLLRQRGASRPHCARARACACTRGHVCVSRERRKADSSVAHTPRSRPHNGPLQLSPGQHSTSQTSPFADWSVHRAAHGPSDNKFRKYKQPNELQLGAAGRNSAGTNERADHRGRRTDDSRNRCERTSGDAGSIRPRCRVARSRLIAIDTRDTAGRMRSSGQI